MHINHGMWLATVVISLVAIWRTIPQQQIWYRRAILGLWLCSGLLAYSSYYWAALLVQISYMFIATSAWQHRAAWQLREKAQHK